MMKKFYNSGILTPTRIAALEPGMLSGVSIVASFEFVSNVFVPFTQGEGGVLVMGALETVL